MIEFVKLHGVDVLTCLTYLISAFSIIASITKTPKDDKIADYLKNLVKRIVSLH